MKHIAFYFPGEGMASERNMDFSRSEGQQRKKEKGKSRMK